VRAAGGHLLLTAERPPTAWPILLPDLASRLRSAMVVPLEPPDDALLAAVAIKQLADRQLHISPDVIPILITRSERSFAGLSRSIDAIDRRALARRREITAKFARDVLQELDDADSTPTGA
jgi:chromosomal replication initiation ATPase DnaA